MLNVDDFLNLEKSYEKHPEKYCEICGDPLPEDKNTFAISDRCENLPKTEIAIRLKCGHQYHYGCLEKHFFYSKYRECPYCRCEAEYLHLLDGEKPLKHVHKEYYRQADGGGCQSILKSGKNKGQKCGKKIFEGKFCKRHIQNKV